MPDNPIEGGVKTLKKLPPLALVGIVAVGVGAALYLKSRSKKPSEETVPTYQAEQLVALERGPVGALPTSFGPPAPTIVDEQITAPRRDTSATAPTTAPIREPKTPVATIGAGTTPAKTPGATGTTGGPPKLTPAAPPAPVQPQPAKPISYDDYLLGFPNDYVLNCNLAFKGLHGSYEYVEQTQKAKKLSSTSTMRNMVGIAVSGNTKWLWQGYDAFDIPGNSIELNRARVFNGLYPLTVGQIKEMQNDFRTINPTNNESAEPFRSGTLARALFAKWNAPYQCDKNAPPRRDIKK